MILVRQVEDTASASASKGLGLYTKIEDYPLQATKLPIATWLDHVA